MIEDFNSLLNDLVDLIVIYDINNRVFIDINNNCHDLSDYSKEEILRLFVSEDNSIFLQTIETINQNGKIQHEQLIKKKDNSLLWIEVQQRIYKKNELEYLIIIISDINERKNKEIALAESEQKYHEIADNMLDLICSIDKDFIVTYSSPSHKKILGYETSELMGKSVFKCVHPDSVSLAIQLGKEAISNRNDAIIELKYITKNNEERWLEASARPKFNEQGEFDGAFISSRDITDKKNTEEQLQSVFRRIQNIFDFLPDPTFVIDKDHRVIAWNHAIENMTGVKYENIVLKGNYEHSLPFYKERRPILIDFICNPHFMMAKYYSYFERDGDSIYAETYTQYLNNNNGAFLWGKASPLYDKNGNIEGAIESIRDITKYRKDEMALKESEERYRQIVNLSPDAIILLSEEIVTYANQSTIKLFSKNILNQDFLEFMKNITNLEYHTLLIDNMRSIIDNKVNSIALEIQLKNSTNRPIDLKIIGDSFLYLQKRVIQLIIVDITLQKSVQRKLQNNISEKEKHINSLKNELEKLMSNENIESTIIGRSKESLSLREFIKEVCDVDAHVLITGESGTGKELIAKSIHQSSNRKKKIFVPINCGAIPEDLIESELFGHEEGAFTGAKKKKIGKIEFANGGTLFLDEIGDLSLILQVKLLRFLEDKIIVPVGGNTPIEVDVRIILQRIKILNF